MYKFLFIPLIAFLSTTTLFATHEYAIGKVRKGETTETFLRRYLLSPHICNIEEFCKLNSLRSKGKINFGKTYKLPLKIVKYDGRTIRSSVGIQDFKEAQKIEKFNKELVKSGVRTNDIKDNNRLWYPYVEFNCPNDAEPVLKSVINIPSSKKEDNEKIELPTKSDFSKSVAKTKFKRNGISTINVALMGEEYAEIHIEDFSLQGQVYYIIAGHGGPDPGAVTTSNNHEMCEDEYAYDVALRLARDLMQHGATVHMIVQDNNDGIRDDAYLECDRDEKELGKFTIPISQKQRLRERAALVNRLYRKYKAKGVTVQKSIEIHVDSRNASSRQDAYFYFNESSSGSKKLASTLQEVFESKYATHQKDRGYQGFVEDRNIYMVKNLLPTAVFVELANIRNVNDQQRLLINTNRQALANWLFEGMRKK